MPALTLQRLQLEGFGPFREQQVWRLDGQSTLIQVTGENRVNPELMGNGVGKTTLFDAITFTMYGKTAAGDRGPDLVNWADQGTAKLKLDFLVNGWGHTIYRAIKPNALSLKQRGGDERTIEQHVLDDLFGLSFDAHLTALHHAQAVPSFLDIGPTAQLAMLSDLLQLGTYDKAADLAGDYAKKESSSVNNFQVAIAHRRGQLIVLEKRQDDLDNRHVDYLRQRYRFLRDCDREIEGWRRQLQISQRKLADAEERITSVDESDVKYDKLKSEDALHELAQHSAERSLLRTRRAQLVTALKETYACPTCGRKFADSVGAANHAENELDKIDDDIKWLSEKITRLQAEADSYTRRFLNRGKEIEGELEAKRKRCREYEAAVAQNREAIAQLQNRRKEFVGARNPYIDDVEETEHELSEIQSQLERRKFALDQTQRHEANLLFWVRAFKDLRLTIVEAALLQLTVEVNTALDQLGLPTWRLVVDAESLTKGGNVRRGMRIAVMCDGVERPTSRISEGERQRLRLAIVFGMADVIENITGISHNIELFDEPTNWLSPAGISALLTVLEDRARLRNRRIFLADHRSLAYAFGERLHLVKDERGTTLTEE